jgi:hypothetical protein
VNLSLQTGVRTAEAIDRGNRRLAFVVRWGMLASAVLIAGNAINRKFFGVAPSTAVIPEDSRRPIKKSRTPCGPLLSNPRLSRNFLNRRKKDESPPK